MNSAKLRDGFFLFSGEFLVGNFGKEFGERIHRGFFLKFSFRVFMKEKRYKRFLESRGFPVSDLSGKGLTNLFYHSDLRFFCYKC